MIFLERNQDSILVLVSLSWINQALHFFSSKAGFSHSSNDSSIYCLHPFRFGICISEIWLELLTNSPEDTNVVSVAHFTAFPFECRILLNTSQRRIPPMFSKLSCTDTSLAPGYISFLMLFPGDKLSGCEKLMLVLKYIYNFVFMRLNFPFVFLVWVLGRKRRSSLSFYCSLQDPMLLPGWCSCLSLCWYSIPNSLCQQSSLSTIIFSSLWSLFFFFF